jgi:hypothetical protein
MTNYEINFKDNVRRIKGYAMNIMNVPITQIYEDLYQDHNVTVTIDPEWTEANFATLIDIDDFLWLFPLPRKDAVTKELLDIGKL